MILVFMARKAYKLEHNNCEIVSADFFEHTVEQIANKVLKRKTLCHFCANTVSVSGRSS